MTSCLLAWFWRTRIKSLLSSAFNTRSKSRTLGTAGSVMIVDLSINGMLALEKTVVWREKTRLASPEVGLRRFQRFDDAIQGEPRFLLLTRSRRQTGEALLAGCKWCEEWSFNFPCTNVFRNDTFYVKTRLFLCGEIWVQSNLHVQPSFASDFDHLSKCSKHKSFPVITL